jgi:hypothetical protein
LSTAASAISSSWISGLVVRLIEQGLLLQRLAPSSGQACVSLPAEAAIERLYIGAGMLLYDIVFSYSGGRPPGVPRTHR